MCVMDAKTTTPNELDLLKAKGYEHFMRLESIRQQIAFLDAEAKKEMESINILNQSIESFEKSNSIPQNEMEELKSST